MKGKVKWFDSKKGYGFIEQESGKDIFVHKNETTDNIRGDDNVEFDIGEGKKGPCAINVKKV